MFDSVMHNNQLDGMKHFTSLLLSLLVHAAALCTLIILPLIFVNSIQSGELIKFVFTPAPPLPVVPTPPPMQTASSVARGPVITTVNYGTPKRIPDGIPDAPTEEPDVDYAAAILDGVPAGAKGPGVSAAIVWAITPVSPKPLEPLKPIALKPREQVKMGGIILNARLIRKVIPVYPRIAQIARVSGPVDIEATIDEEGNVTNLHVISGHVLLRKAAEEAVRQWKYRPLFLNGEPVPILASITVVFRLN